mgnify:CR=1 FL=1
MGYRTALMEVEVLNESEEIIYNGLADDLVAMDFYDDELEEMLNNLQRDRELEEIEYYDENGMEYLIRKVA